jgi:chromosome segregation ATPase
MGKKKEAADPASSAENIKVIVRCRPLNSKEKDAGYKSCVDLDPAEATVQVNHLCGAPDRWTFDGVVNNTYTQKDIFTQFIMPMVDSVMDGFNATVFAYGQSGSGKTHTMTGVYDDEELKGIIPRSFRHIFECIKQQSQSNPGKRYSLYCCFIELYNGKVRDLLAKQQVTLAVKENKDKTFFVQGAHIPQVKFEEELTRLMEEGTERRVVDSTELNAASSRSHSIFSIIIECTETTEDGDTRSVTSKLNLVDLAGSERQSKTGATGDTLKEGCNINLSLSALGTVIDTLVKGKGHVPFRSSPLTMLLKDSLGGSSKTCMFANIGPSEHNISETVSTLRFADRAKQIKNKPVVNMDSKDQKIAELTEQVADLKLKLQKFESGGFAELEEEVEKLRERCGELEVDRDNAVKGREADAVDFERTSQTIQQQLTVAQQEREELRDQLSRITDELKVAEELARDESKQSKEIWSLCTAEFGEPIETVDSLIQKLRELKNGVSRKQYEAVQKQANDLLAELETLRGQHELEVAQMQAAAKNAEEELLSGQRKLEKMKEQLLNEQTARKQLVEHHADLSPHKSGTFMRSSTDEVAQLKDAIHQLEEQRDSNEQVKALETQLKSVSSENATVINSLMKQIEALTAQVSSGGSEGEDVAMWKRMLVAKDEALLASRAEVEALEEQLDELRHLRMDRRRSSARNLADVREQFYRQQRDNLRDELQTTVDHRDHLLDHIISAAPGDVSSELQALRDENQRLRTKIDNLSSAIDSSENRPKDEINRLEGRVQSLEAQLTAERKSFAERESKMLEALNGEGTDKANPLASVVEILRSEKAQLLTQLDRLSTQLADGQSAFAEKNAEEQAQEIQRLQSILTTPAKDDSEAVAELKAELRKRDEDMRRLESRPSKQAVSLEAAALSEEQSRIIESEFKAQVDLLQMENQRLSQEIENVKADLAEESRRRTQAEELNRGALQQVADAKKETAEEHRKAVQALNDVEAIQAQLQTLTKDTGKYTSEIDSLRQRVEERNDQLKKLRDALDNQRQMMDKMKQKLEAQQQSLNSAKQELALKDQQFQVKLQEQAEYLQKITNKKLEQQSEEHKKALIRKDDEVHTIRKKMKKLDDKLDKQKSKYDEKCLEYAELQARMEEQKLEQMQALREQHVVQIETGQELIRDTLQDAKEAQRRKADLFAQGEVTSALAGLRAAGSAAVALSRARLSTASGPAPPSGHPTNPGRGSLYD